MPETDTRGPLQWAGLVPPARGVRHADDTSFDDGTGYDQRFAGASLSAGAAVNATTLQIRLGSGLILIEGMRFSTPDDRMHEIDEVVSRSGDVWTVRILPWLRAAYPADTALNFEAPRCRMRLATEETGALTIAQRALSNPTLDLTEAF